MTREQKYPETSTFHFYNANPRNRFTTDCVIRAISTATEIPYNKVIMEMAQMQCETGYDMSESKLIDLYLKSKNWIKQKQPRKSDNTKYTGYEFCYELNHMACGSVIANIGGHHIVCIKEVLDKDDVYRFKVHDTWNSTDGCIGNYWIKAAQ